MWESPCSLEAVWWQYTEIFFNVSTSLYNFSEKNSTMAAIWIRLQILEGSDLSCTSTIFTYFSNLFNIVSRGVSPGFLALKDEAESILPGWMVLCRQERDPRALSTKLKIHSKYSKNARNNYDKLGRNMNEWNKSRAIFWNILRASNIKAHRLSSPANSRCCYYLVTDVPHDIINHLFEISFL